MPVTKGSFQTKAALVTTILLWASAFPGIRAGLLGYSPGGLALFRFLIASLCMVIIYKFFAFRHTKVKAKDALLLLLIGAVSQGGYHTALNYGEISVPAGTASFMVSLSPVLTVLFAAFFLKEKISKWIFVGIAISIFGVSLMTLTLSNKHVGLHVGVICLVVATLMSGAYSVLQKPFLSKYHAIDVNAYVMWGAALFLLIFTPNLYHDLHSHPSLHSTIAVIYLGIFPAGIAYLLWTVALAEVPASRLAISMYFMPIVATILGWIWLHEVPTVFSLIGGVTVLCGVWLVNRSYRAINKKAAKEEMRSRELI